MEHTIQHLQNLWPQLVSTGSRSPRRQIGHLNWRAGSSPSDLRSASSCDRKPSSAGATVLSRDDIDLLSSNEKNRANEHLTQ